MLEFAYVLLFLVSFVAIVALILSRKNLLLVFLLTPLLLVSSLVSGYVMYSMLGSPIAEFPKGKIEIVAVAVKNEQVLTLIKRMETGKTKYYVFPYNEERANRMKKVEGQLERGIKVIGEFKKGLNVSEAEKKFEVDEYQEIEK